MSSKKIVVLGYMGACPIAGVIWQYLHYIIGLQRLGHDVYYVEDTSRYPYNPQRRTVDADYRYAAKTLASLSERFDFRGRWAFRARYLPERPVIGLSGGQLRELYRNADAILNVCASHEPHEDLLESERLILVESDPGALQIAVDKQDAAILSELRRYHRLFTFGESIGTSSFPVPLHGLQWLPTRQPVCTDLWDTAAPAPEGAAYTTITNWSANASFDWRGKTYLWSKALQFMNFVDVPALTGQSFELASDIPDRNSAALFRRNAWRLLHPDTFNYDVDGYRNYVQASKGEFTAAKAIYAALDTGWFSDRSACYLAAGRPVITQETGFTRLYGGTRGLFGFTSMNEALEAVSRIQADYALHCDAARDIAKEYFEARHVLKSLLDRVDM